jgi:transcription elongation GreA/GreB family factor
VTVRLPITRRGLARLAQEIATQEQKVRRVGAEMGAEAGANCDWHDNFGYEDARRRLELESTRLRHLQNRIQHTKLATVIEQNETVALGTTVQLVLDGRELEYTVAGVGEGEAGRGFLSADAPLVQAILGLRVGDETDLRRGPTRQHIEVVRILPPSHRYSSEIDGASE